MNVTIPKGTTIEDVRLEQVVQWAADKIDSGRGVPRRKRASKAPTNGQPAAKPKQTKPPAPKKKAPPRKKARESQVPSGAKRPKRKKGKSD